MIKLTRIEPHDDYTIQLYFSDDSSGEYDFSDYVNAATPMTKPLQDVGFFKRCFVEMGALTWPNGFDLSPAALHERLKQANKLHKAVAV